MATDEQLIEQIQNGKSEAYGQLFRKYYQYIYSICFSILKNPHDAEEVTSETFIHAYLKLDQLRHPSKFFAWLKKIAQNRGKNYMRQRGAETLPLDLAIVRTRQIAPDEHILRQELIDSIIEAIEALPPKDREVIQAHINGLNHSEISKKLSISISASMNRLYRARKKISAQIKDLLYAIVGLPKVLPTKEISGGILAMKIGTSAKVTIGVIGILAAGFIGFKVVTSKPDVKSSKVETQQALTAKGKQGVATVAEHKPLSSKSSHQPKGADSKITQNERDIARLDEKERGEFPTQLVEESSSLDKEMTQEAEQRHDEEYTAPTESEVTAEMLMQKILEAFRNADYETLFAISKGKMREHLEETLEKYGEASAEEKALAKKAELSDSWYVGDEFHFTIIFQGYTHEYILQRDDNKWWLVDDIPAVIKKTGTDRVTTEFNESRH